MAISLAATGIAKASLGAAAIQKISLGTTLLWSAGTNVNDNFNRASLGGNWTTAGYNDEPAVPTLNSNRFHAGEPAGFLSGYEMAAGYTATAALTDNHAVRVTIATALTAEQAGLIVRANAGLKDMVIAKITTSGDKSGIWTMDAGDQTRQKSAATTSFKPGDIAEFRVSGNIYQLVRNPDSAATIVATWTDTDADVKPGPTRRYGGLWASSSKEFSGTATYSADLDDFAFRDL
ncbi:hypothetical protein [Nocardia pseudobrasiliensis]|uniref:Uncharacterized protein n=1 Tax=Nocardia pseudobrasiliensis TaxID=45979 RepID=A0A370I4V5_9NOCA|nr:hypothetical protein [Nocardia pseudobrasiliensis]RDI65777.1 hypothetical protein DFR76_10592 [Nocardia pseudobrasiliensis]